VKVSTESLGNCQTALTIEAEASELDKSLDEAYHHLVNEYPYLVSAREKHRELFWCST